MPVVYVLLAEEGQFELVGSIEPAGDPPKLLDTDYKRYDPVYQVVYTKEPSIAQHWRDLLAQGVTPR